MTNSQVSQVNGSSNVAVNNNSGNVTINNQGNLDNQQAPFYAPGSTFNYYSTPVTNTVTREAFETFEGVVSNAMSNTTEKVELTAQQVQLLAQALKDLDQRTSDIEKLPDGRTKFGNYVSGVPKVVIEAAEAGIKCYTNRDFHAALQNFQRAINAFELTTLSGVLIETGGGVRPEGKGELYWYAGICAQRLGSNNIANEFAEKAVKANPQPKTKILFTTTLANLAAQDFQNNDFNGSLELFKEAITNYESIDSIAATNLLEKKQVLKLYSEAARSAFAIGKTNEVREFNEKFVEFLKR